MIWLFAVVVVIALAVIAVVAAGAGAPMKDVSPDRPVVDWPAGVPITPEVVRRATFSTAVRGYRMDEVDALLNALARQLEDAERAGERSADGTADGTPFGG